MTSLARRQFRVLYREVLFPVIDRDLLSSHATGDSSKLLLQVAALLISFSFLMSLGVLGYGSDRLYPQIQITGDWSFEHFLIATTMLAVGLFAVLSWDSMF